jgi:hypothetical protein
MLQSPTFALGMAMLIAALAADGESEIRNIVQVDRGYERIEERLHSHQPQAVSSPATFRREALISNKCTCILCSVV